MEETPKKIVEERVGERHTKNDCIGGYFQRGFLKDKEILRRGGGVHEMVKQNFAVSSHDDSDCTFLREKYLFKICQLTQEMRDGQEKQWSFYGVLLFYKNAIK